MTLVRLYNLVRYISSFWWEILTLTPCCSHDLCLLRESPTENMILETKFTKIINFIKCCFMTCFMIFQLWVLFMNIESLYILSTYVFNLLIYISFYLVHLPQYTIYSISIDHIYVCMAALIYYVGIICSSHNHD